LGFPSRTALGFTAAVVFHGVPNHEEKKKLEAVRLELANALNRVNDVLKSPDRNGNGSAPIPTTNSGKIPVEMN
jgi:hypothetical protein